MDKKVIKVDFRKGRLSIDEDRYMDGVSEIHCRACERRRPRRGSVELRFSWGFICESCRNSCIERDKTGPGTGSSGKDKPASNTHLKRPIPVRHGFNLERGGPAN